MSPTSPPLPVPFPVEFGPHVADWWMVGLTLLAVIANSVVALMAYFGARDAKRLAQRADENEKARLARDDREKAVARADSVRRTYAKHLVVLGNHANELAEFVAAQAGTVKPRMSVPTNNAILADLQVVRLFVPEDRAALLAVFDLENKLRLRSPDDRQTTVIQLIVWMTKWRMGELTDEEFTAKVSDEAAKNTAASS